MLKGGDSVFYPFHGTGTIESTEIMREREYFKIFFPYKKLHVFVPSQSENQNGLRPIISLEQLEQVKLDFYDNGVPLPSSVSERSKVLDSKMKLGTTLEISQIIRDLMHFHTTDGRLSQSDKKVYKNAEEFLIGEIQEIKNISYDQASSDVKSLVEERFNIDAPNFR
ncbi:MULTISPECIES: CarD family transcriptional regulator [Bacillaceae]|uniref:CarD family transcriptional regulator n=1 Tax=Bacillaceae TaxID=186817 RepID=UPI0015956FAB|nr:CarD family transcriptional regulator [Virgibacillus sp. 7505]